MRRPPSESGLDRTPSPGGENRDPRRHFDQFRGARPQHPKGVVGVDEVGEDTAIFRLLPKCALGDAQGGAHDGSRTENPPIELNSSVRVAVVLRSMCQSAARGSVPRVIGPSEGVGLGRATWAGIYLRWYRSNIRLRM